MKGYLQMLERSKKREIERSFELGPAKNQVAWFTLQRMEEEATRMAHQLQPLLPGEVQLKRKAVKMQSYAQAQGQGKIQIKSQVSSINRKEVEIKLHCHQLKAKGKPVKLALAVYSFAKVYEV